MPDSSVAGYLRPGAVPAIGTTLEDIFQRVIVGVTGIPGNLVRPRDQPTPPAQPDFSVDWCAFNVVIEPVIWNAFKTLNPDGSYTVEGSESLELRVSFYGPNYQARELDFRHGLQIGQNRDELSAANIALVDFADPVYVPALMKEQRVKKADVRGNFLRWTVRNYPVLSFLSADVIIYTATSQLDAVIQEAIRMNVNVSVTDIPGDLTAVAADLVNIDIVAKNINSVNVASVTQLKTWALTEAFTIDAGVRDPVTGALLSAAVLWPDGGAGVFTAITQSTAWPGAVDVATLTYGVKTMTLTVVTRDSLNGGALKTLVAIA